MELWGLGVGGWPWPPLYGKEIKEIAVRSFTEANARLRKDAELCMHIADFHVH